MKFLLQEGYNMRGINEAFGKAYNDLGVILSPRAIGSGTPISSVKDQAQVLKQQGVQVMFDPSYYMPKNVANKLNKFPYFRGDTQLKICEQAINYQVDKLGVDALIIPATYTESATEAWFDTQESYVDLALGISDAKRYMSLPLGQGLVADKNAMKTLVEKCVKYPVDGFYVVLEHSNYLVEEKEYIYHAMEAMLDFVIAGKEVILAYGNQQSLFYSAVGIDCLATGNTREVRHFDPQMFSGGNKKSTEEGTLYYFDGNSFGEYNRKQLRGAYQSGLKDYFGPMSSYCEELLSNTNPIRVSWSKENADSHYLLQMKQEVDAINKIEASDRAQYCLERLSRIKEHNRRLYKEGFKIGDRGFFGRVSNATIYALEKLKEQRGADLSNL